MKKRKTYEVSVINKTHSKTYSDETKFYTSDTALELNFQLKEVEYDFDSAEIILLNIDDRSLATRPVVKGADGFTYELEDDIVEHYGEWKGQLKFNEGGEIYVSSPVIFRIENDLNNDRPPKLTEVNTWKNLREFADKLIIDLQIEQDETLGFLENRQDTVESKFDLLQQELTDKDPISAPEIIAARNGEANLKTRLDKEHQNVSTQLAQTDFVSQVSRLIGGYDKMYYKKENTLNWITVMLRNKNEHVSWTFRNNDKDDFIILGDCFYGNVTSALMMNENIIYSILSGGFVTAGVSHYTTEVGAKITNDFTGSRIDFQSYRDNRGGVWEFVVDGDTENKKIHSTYSSTAGQSGYVTLFEGLSEGKHTIVGTFLGDDPNNPPSGGAGTSRGWINYGSTDASRTYRTYKTQLTNNKVQELLFAGSNKEFAFRIKKSNSSHSSQFVPMHSGIGTAFQKSEPHFIVDDTILDYQNLPIGEFFECNTFSLVQSVYGRNPESADENLMEINTNVSINKSGNVEITGKMKPLTEIYVENGYGIMFPVRKDITTKAISSKGNEYPTIKTDYSSTFMVEEADTTTSFAFVSEENPDFIASIRFNDIRNTLRTGLDKGANPLWIEHRDNILQKLYYRPFYNKVLTPSDMFKFSATFNCGKVQGVYNVV